MPGRAHSAELLQALLDRAPVIVYRYRFDPPGFEYINRAAERITGYPLEDFYADPEIGARLAHPDDRAVLLDLLEAGWRTGPHRSRWIREDGETIWVEQQTVSVHDEHGELKMMEGVVLVIDDPTAGPGASIRTVGGIRIDLLEQRVYVEGHEVRLTPVELKVLALLAESPGKVVSRQTIMRHLWRSVHAGDGHTCETHVSNLRRKIEREPRHPARLLTVRGQGYRLVP